MFHVNVVYLKLSYILSTNFNKTNGFEKIF